MRLFDHVAVMIDTEFGWYVPVLSLSTHYVDENGHPPNEHVTLNTLTNWNGVIQSNYTMFYFEYFTILTQ